ncbi:MAG: DMT family transporter [Betaproteobacteria bacterium]
MRGSQAKISPEVASESNYPPVQLFQAYTDGMAAVVVVFEYKPLLPMSLEYKPRHTANNVCDIDRAAAMVRLKSPFTHQRFPSNEISNLFVNAQSTIKRPIWLPYAVLGSAVLIVSSAAIMIRVAQAEGLSSIAIAAWRLAIAAALLWPIAWAKNRSEILALRKRDWLLGIAAGLFLAMHFATWISSLAYTSVASSLALVSTNPIWIALVSWIFLREKLGLWLLVGIAAAIGGSSFIFLSDARLEVSGVGRNPMLGNLLALLGSLTVCGYLLIGRRLRMTIALIPYIWLVYSSAAFALVISALVAGYPLTGFSSVAWLCLIGLAIGPQLLGHSAFNWALKHVSATFIAIVILGEPIGSALLAWLIFGERFEPLQLAGFAMLLAGIYLASRGERDN